MKDFRIIFVHGYTASSKADWYPAISVELEKLGVDFAIPDLPGGEHPHAAEWLETIHTEVMQSSKPLVFVGHSLGTRAALLYLEKYKPKVKHAVLIAAFANDTRNAKREKRCYADFFRHTINTASIKPLVDSFTVIHSTDDPSIPYDQGVVLAKELEADFITYKDKDHFFEPRCAPDVLTVLRTKIGF